MKVRRRAFAVNWNPARKVYIAKSLLMQHKVLLRAATVAGMRFKGWFRDGHPRYQVMHLDLNSGAGAFYRAIGVPLPLKFATRCVTVGGLTRLVGYMKLHVTQADRDNAEEEILESEAEDDDG